MCVCVCVISCDVPCYALYYLAMIICSWQGGLLRSPIRLMHKTNLHSCMCVGNFMLICVCLLSIQARHPALPLHNAPLWALSGYLIEYSFEYSRIEGRTAITFLGWSSSIPNPSGCRGPWMSANAPCFSKKRILWILEQVQIWPFPLSLSLHLCYGPSWFLYLMLQR